MDTPLAGEWALAKSVLPLDRYSCTRVDTTLYQGTGRQTDEDSGGASIYGAAVTKLEQVLQAFQSGGALTIQDAADITGQSYRQVSAHVWWLCVYQKLRATNRTIANGRSGRKARNYTVYEVIG